MDPCFEFDDQGDQIWTGPEAPGVYAFADELQALADSYQDQVTGTAICTGRDAVAIFLASEDPELAEATAAVAKKHPNFRLEVRYVALPLSELLELAPMVARAEPIAKHVVGYGPDIYTGGLRIFLDVSDHDTLESLRAATEDAAFKAAHKPVPIRVAYEDPLEEADATRANDSSPWKMGAELTYTNSAGGTSRCSAGIPITVSGQKTLMTAGHCVGSWFFNNGNTVGGQFTTAYPGNAGIYGDWKLIRDSTYSLRVFNGPLSSSTTLSITGANWGVRSNGSGVCTSGRTTAQVCRYFVVGTNMTVTSDGVVSGHLTTMRHDSSGGSGSDLQGFQGGDSGGPCYYAVSPGVYVAGIVKSRNTSTLRYRCTQLTGLRQWNSGATLG
jgi:hypothetical protein